MNLLRSRGRGSPRIWDTETGMTRGWKNKKGTKRMREGRGRKETRIGKGYSKETVLSEEGEEGKEEGELNDDSAKKI